EALEGMATYLATGKISKDELNKLEVIFYNEIKDIKEGNKVISGRQAFPYGIQLHKLILEASNNRFILEMHKTLKYQVERLIIYSQGFGRYERALDEHYNIIMALLEGDAKKAEHKMREHIKNVAKDLINDTFIDI
ncbi:MAG: FCD domain-containing protein, partial [Sedimentibacter sp.]